MGQEAGDWGLRIEDWRLLKFGVSGFSLSGILDLFCFSDCV